MCKTDCGRCIDCIETDDYGPAWRNPLFRPPAAAVSAPLAPEPAENVHAPALTIDGFTAALRALGRDGGESHA